MKYSEAGQQVDYYFIYGNNMDEVISGYRTLTGKATIVPKWALVFGKAERDIKPTKGDSPCRSFLESYTRGNKPNEDHETI